MAITANRFFSTDPHTMSCEVEDRFFTHLKTHNNTFKRTASNRFRSLDERCAAHFAVAGSALREVLDIGISSGSTTLALAARFRSAGQVPRITGTDVSLTGYIVSLSGSLRVLVDEYGHPLQYEVLGRAVRAWGRRADYLTGMAGARWLLRRLIERPVRWRMKAGAPSIREVRLLSPRIEGATDIHVEKNDVFQHTPHFAGRFDFIRAANILNLCYFDEAALRTAFANVIAYLSGPGAWLLVARSRDGATAATLFRVSPDGRRLAVTDRIGGGSEVERLVLSTPLPFRWVKA